jgi:RHS repeat-associated protein
VGLAQTFDAYGNGYASAGSAQSTLGYTNEYTDATGLLYLRARYYNPQIGRFFQMDPSSQERNPYQYGLSNPVLHTDPSGLMPLVIEDTSFFGVMPQFPASTKSNSPFKKLAGVLDSCDNLNQHLISHALADCSESDCERFVDEVRRFIAEARLQGVPDPGIVWFLAVYYTGSRLTIGDSPVLCPPGALCRDLDWAFTIGDRWLLPDSLAYRVVENPRPAGSEEATLQYGFKRMFYDNTHHYFFDFYVAYFWGPWLETLYNDRREVEQLDNGEQNYYEAAADIMIGRVAADHAFTVLGGPIDGVSRLDQLPDLLLRDACGNTVEEIYEGWGPPNSTVENLIGPWE